MRRTSRLEDGGTALGQLQAKKTPATTRHAVAAFLVLSAFFGTIVAFITPPMRGPDEPAHFVRAYALSRGEIVPRQVDAEGRKGTFIPLRLQREFELFESSRYRIWDADFTYRRVFSDYAELRRSQARAGDGDQVVFTLYGGSEGYSPIPYLPYLPAVTLARALGLDFLSTIYLMRMSGLVVLTMMAAYAIALLPRLKWTFLFIAFLPSAIYSRSTLSGDGMTLASAMVVSALYLKHVRAPDSAAFWSRPLWVALSALSKPPNLVFVLLEAAVRPLAQLPRHWRSLMVGIFPAVILAVGWALVSSSDVALWRVTDAGDPQQFDPRWRLRFMWDDPGHFFRQLAGSSRAIIEYGQQLVGVLGWLDAPLHRLVYPVVGLGLIVLLGAQPDLPPHARLRVAAVFGLTVLAYGLAVFMIFYLVWTPISADQIRGVQGRYFVPILPLASIALSAAVNRGLPETAQATIAGLGAVFCGLATIEAGLRVDWRFALPAWL